MAAAPPSMKLWLLLCSDLAIRSGTSAKIGPDQYDPGSGQLIFVTKRQEKVTLPVTDEIRQLIARCSMHSRQSFVRQLRMMEPNTNAIRANCRTPESALHQKFTALCKKAGIQRRITPHDFRRTTAVNAYKETRDLLLCQALLGHADPSSTSWYLDAYRREVPASLLETIKKPNAQRQKEKIA